MNAAASITRDALLPQRPAGMGAGLILALMAHALLVVALTFSVRWNTSDPAGVEAELWAAVPQIAAPRAVEPEPTPAPAPPPVEVKPPAPPPPPPRVEPAPSPVPDAQIAIEKAKREEAKREAEKLAAEKLAAEKREAEKKEAEKRDTEKRLAEKRLAEKREEARLEQQRAKEELDRKKKEQAAKLKQEESRAAADQQKIEAARQENLKRMLGQAGATGAPSSTGTAAQSAGPSAGYAGRIRARIQPNIVFGETVSGNPLATVEVRTAPDGTIVGKRLIKSSGVPAWDDAVLRAIDKTEILPRDTDGRVPPKLEIDFRPRD